jgi:hypothetical protein
VARPKDKSVEPASRDVAVNRRAFHDYEILERIDAGISLTGSEIKSIRAGKVSLQEAYARPERATSGSSARTSPSTARLLTTAMTRAGRGACCCIGPRSATSSARSRPRD